MSSSSQDHDLLKGNMESRDIITHAVIQIAAVKSLEINKHIEIID